MAKGKSKKIHKHIVLHEVVKVFDQVRIIKLPGEEVKVGPGTVPISTASVSQTLVKDMVSGLRKASREGLFEGSISPEDHGPQ